MQTDPKPQGAQSPFANSGLQDQVQSYQAIEANLTERQRVITIGSRIPIVFCKEEEGEGGAWVTPPAGKFGVQINPGAPTAFSIGTVVSDGQIGTIAAADVYKGAYSILTVPNYKVTFAYNSMPSTGFDYTLSNREIKNIEESVGGTMTTKFTVKRAAIRKLQFIVTKIASTTTGASQFFTWKCFQNGQLVAQSQTGTSVLGVDFTFSWPTPRDVEVQLFAAAIGSAAQITYSSPATVNGLTRTDVEVVKPIGADEKDLPVFAGSGGTFGEMSCLAVGGQIRAYEEAGGPAVKDTYKFDVPFSGGTATVYTVKNAVYIKGLNLSLKQIYTLNGYSYTVLEPCSWGLYFNGALVKSGSAFDYRSTTPGTFEIKATSVKTGRATGDGTIELFKAEDAPPPASTITSTSTPFVVSITTEKFVVTVADVLSLNIASLVCSTSGGTKYSFRYQLFLDGELYDDTSAFALQHDNVGVQLPNPATIALYIIPQTSPFPAGVSARGTAVTTKTDGSVPPVTVVGTGPITWDQQIRCFVRNGVSCTRYLGSPASGSSNNFADLARYLLTATDRVSNARIDDTSFLAAAKWTNTERFLFNGVISSPVNVREYLQRLAPFFLLRFGLIGGEYSLVPVVGVKSDGSLNLDPAVPKYTLKADSIIENSLKWEFINLSERPRNYVAVNWREQASTSYSVVKTVEVKEVATLLDAPRDYYDMSDFCTNYDHARRFAKWTLAFRRLVTHKIEFASSQDLLPQIAFGNLIRLNFDATPSVRLVASESELYRVDSVSESDTGILRVKATHCPVTQDGVEAVSFSYANDSFGIYL